MRLRSSTGMTIKPWPKRLDHYMVTSLPAFSTIAKKVVDIHSTRMLIEESFRDVKSIRFE
jgi:hypothetical protein